MAKPKNALTAGERIAQLRAAKGLSLRQLGKLADVDHAHIYNIEHGRKNPSKAMLEKLLRTLGERRAIKVRTVLCFGGEELEMKP